MATKQFNWRFFDERDWYTFMGAVCFVGADGKTCAPIIAEGETKDGAEVTIVIDKDGIEVIICVSSFVDDQYDPQFVHFRKNVEMNPADAYRLFLWIDPTNKTWMNGDLDIVLTNIFEFQKI